MRTGRAATPHQSSEAEADIGRHIRIHSQQFAQVDPRETLDPLYSRRLDPSSDA
jgi:hypothetical protein